MNKRYSLIKRSKGTKRSKRSKRPKRSKRTKRSKINKRFGTPMGPNIYGVHMDDGILLANNAFSDAGNPLVRALNA